MANKTEDRQGMLFVGCIIVGSGIGLMVGTITGNWIYLSACAAIGVGVGFIGMSFLAKK